MTLDELRDVYRQYHKRELDAGDIPGLGGPGGHWASMSKEDFISNVVLPSDEYTFGPYRRLLKDWYGQKPATPPTFRWTPEQEAAAKRGVGEEYRPFYQEQATQSGEEFKNALMNARAGFSRRGLWGAAGGVEQKIDPATGLAYTVAAPAETTAGPQSGLRQVGEQKLGEAAGRTSTAFGRAYTQAVAGGVQGRQAESQDVYQKTIRDPYDQAYREWLTRLQGLQSGR